MEANKITGLGLQLSENQQIITIQLYDTEDTESSEREPYQSIILDRDSYNYFVRMLLSLTFRVQEDTGLKLVTNIFQTEKDQGEENDDNNKK